MKADFKIVAKSYARIANAYMKQGMFDEAIRAFEDSLMEDRTSPISPLYLPYISPPSRTP